MFNSGHALLSHRCWFPSVGAPGKDFNLLSVYRADRTSTRFARAVSCRQSGNFGMRGTLV
jgi:hypothetical protein